MTREEFSRIKEMPGEERIARPGEVVLREHDTSSLMYIVLEGMGLRYKTLPDGSRQVVGFMFPGDMVGLQAGFSDKMGHALEATTQMRLRTLKTQDLERTFEDDPERALAITRFAVEEESALGEALATVGQREAIARLAWLFCKIHDRLTSIGMDEDVGLPLPYRQQDVADALGLSLVHTNKTLAKLKRDDIASWTGKTLHIHDFNRLQQLLDGADINVG
ncbi:MAG: Crp/Fnr family transcriptional regulator [Pseudomonadota bacterium]